MNNFKLNCFVLVLLIFTSSICSGLTNDKQLKAEFTKAYMDWKKHIKEFNQRKMPIEYFIYNKYYARITLLGVQVLPLLVKKIREGDYLLNNAFFKISRLTHRDLEPFAFYVDKNRESMARIILRWWDVKRMKTRDRFEIRYSKFFNALKKSTFSSGSSDYKRWVLPVEYDPLLSMGVFILPNVIEKLKAVYCVKGIVDSEKSFILSFLFMRLVDKHSSEMEKDLKIKKKFEPQTKTCLAWWKKFKDKWILKEMKTKKG